MRAARLFVSVQHVQKIFNKFFRALVKIENLSPSEFHFSLSAAVKTAKNPVIRNERLGGKICLFRLNC